MVTRARTPTFDVSAPELPLALAAAHAASAVGDRWRATFRDWDVEHLRDVVVGGGFAIESCVPTKRRQALVVTARRLRTLPDFVAPGLRLIVVGLNPSLYAADAGVGFARPGNRFWPAALDADLVSRDRDPWHAVTHDRVGMTDLVKRATVGASELSAREYRDGLARVTRLVEWLAPGGVCFAGLAGWRAAVDRKAVAGMQPQLLGGVPVYVMPNPSGLNAHDTVVSLAAHLRAAKGLADESTG